MKVSLGYFVPEFPTQTHVFFWREMRALERLGISPELVSTRRPAADLTAHEWAREAIARTCYLYPPGLGGILEAAWEVIRAGPGGWLRCLRVVKQADVGGPRGRLRLLGLALMGGRLAGLARRRGWRHIHVHSCANAAHIALFASCLTGLSYSLTLHGPLSDYGPDQAQKWRHAAFAIVITRRLLSEVREQLDGSLPARVEIAPMGVELEGFRRQSPYRPWTGKGPCRFFSCGRLHPCKGHENLVRAVGMLRRDGVDARLRIAGEDATPGRPHRRALEELIAGLALADHVELLGAISEDSVSSELEAAHVFALASLEEPLGVAIMEAMAMEMPVVATGAGGVPELIDDGENGVLVGPGRAEELAAALRRVLQHTDLAEELGKAARRKVMGSFDSGVSAAAIARGLGHGAKAAEASAKSCQPAGPCP